MNCAVMYELPLVIFRDASDTLIQEKWSSPKTLGFVCNSGLAIGVTPYNHILNTNTSHILYGRSVIFTSFVLTKNFSLDE